MNTVQGGELMLFFRDKTLALATSHKLTINAESIENSSKDNGGGKWKSSTVKKMSWTVTSDNLFLEKGDTTKKQVAFGDIFNLMITRVPVDVVFGSQTEKNVDDIPSSGWTAESKGIYSGKAIITSLDLNAPNGENATYSVTMEGVGELKHTNAEGVLTASDETV